MNMMNFKKIIRNCLNDNLARIRKEREENWERWKNWRMGGGERHRGKVILFGASEMCEICIRHLEELGITIDFICDNDYRKHGEFITDSGQRIKIVSVEEAMSDASRKLCYVAAGDQHFESIFAQLKQYDIAEIVMKWHLDFYLKIMIMLCLDPDPFEDRVEEALSFYDDEESLKIVWAHFTMWLELENVPEVLRDVSWEDLCALPQYFLEDGRYLGKQNVMIDCGAYIGDTLEELCGKIKYDGFRRYDCYEIIPSIYEELRKTAGRLPTETRNRIRINNVGVGEEEVVEKALALGESSHIYSNGNIEIRTVRLDDIYVDDSVSFIKMDIEGWEQAAIRGGKNMITRCQPMCAICIYHSVEAFWEIPRLLKEYVPEYKMILRHHTTHWAETVCYAKIGEWTR